MGSHGSSTNCPNEGIGKSAHWLLNMLVADHLLPFRVLQLVSCVKPFKIVRRAVLTDLVCPLIDSGCPNAYASRESHQFTWMACLLA
jgi:hypothetical protein